MATNPYFNNYSANTEQSLIDDLVVEVIQIYGIDMYYMPRTLGAKDDLLNEDDLPIFNSATQIEMYVKNVEGFEGQGDFLSKFGLEIRDSVTFAVSITRFNAEIGGGRPNEGDLIYFPLNDKIFEVMHVEHESVFYQAGALAVYELRCELFEYSNERFQTGVAEIDSKMDSYNTTSNTAIDNIEPFDDLSDNFTIETEADGIIDFDEKNPFGEDNW